MEANLKTLLIASIILFAVMIKVFGLIMTGTILYYLFGFGLVLSLIKIILRSLKQVVPRKR